MPSTLTAVGAVSAALSLFLGLFVLGRRRSANGAYPFALMMLANTLYAAAYTIELNAPDLATAIFWLKVEHFGVTLIPPLWLIFADGLMDKGFFRKPWRRIYVFIVPAITLVIVSSQSLLPYMYTGFSLATVPGLSVIIALRGPWYWVNAAYLYGMLFLGSITIVRTVFKAEGLFRAQSLIISFGVLCPWLAHLALITRKGPLQLDPTPFALAITGVFMVVGIFKLGLFDIVPIARERIFNAIRDGVIVVDLHGRYIDANIAAQSLFPALASLSPGMSALPFLGSIPLSIDSMTGSVDISILVDDTVRHVRVDARKIENHDGSVVGTVILVADTTETTELLLRMARLATTDELTGACNRRHFFELAEREIETSRRKERPISFAMFDLDHFKKINDDHGHAAGDMALRSVSDICRTRLRTTDVFCRYGGEEFVILFPETPPAEAAAIVERLRVAIAQTGIRDGTLEFSITASFGVCGQSNGKPELLSDYLKRIDEAMYRAKKEGRNRVVVDGEPLVADKPK